jgi:cytochrome b561
MTDKIDWKNSEERYGRLAMILHWSVAVLFLCLYCSVYFRHWFTEKNTDINWQALQLHLSFGITVAVFIILRLLYKFWDKSPDEPEGNKMEHLGAKLGHLALYGIMIVMPVTGYMGTGVNTEFFGLFEITQFRNTELYELMVTGWLDLDWDHFEKPVDFIHKRGGATLVWMLILVHIAAALYHHLHKKDNVLRRMLPVSLKEGK